MLSSGSISISPLFFARQAGAFHLVAATAYLVEHVRYRGVHVAGEGPVHGRRVVRLAVLRTMDAASPGPGLIGGPITATVGGEDTRNEAEAMAAEDRAELSHAAGLRSRSRPSSSLPCSSQVDPS